MTKWFGWLMCFVLVALLVGCAAPATPVPPTPLPQVVEKIVEVQAPTPEPTCYIPWVAGNNSDPFYVPGLKGWNEAAQQANVKTDFLGPMEMNLAAQMKVVEEVLARPDTCGVFYYPADFNAVEPFIKDAKAKGIPFIIGAADSPFKTRTAFIGYDNNVLGAQAGAWAADLIGCKGSVGTVGNASAANVTQRIQAFNDYIKATCPDVKIVQQVTHDGSAASGTSAIDSYLVANPDLSLIWLLMGLAASKPVPGKTAKRKVSRPCSWLPICRTRPWKPCATECSWAQWVKTLTRRNSGGC
jgi:ABC-type sugar transport system substrate-binding protein